MVDVRMTGMNGLELVRRARVMQPGLKALIMTGGADVPEVGGGLGAATALLRKPFRAADLAQGIAALMSGNGLPAQ
jgi:DNA-binding NtrC family response regulator